MIYAAISLIRHGHAEQPAQAQAASSPRTRIASIPPAEQFTTTVTFEELLYGAHRLGDRAGSLLSRIESLVPANLQILSFDVEAARRYGALRAELERTGTPLADADLRIASIALSMGLTLVTSNVRHFQRVPGPVIENWLA